MDKPLALYTRFDPRIHKCFGWDLKLWPYLHMTLTVGGTLNTKKQDALMGYPINSLSNWNALTLLTLKGSFKSVTLLYNQFLNEIISYISVLFCIFKITTYITPIMLRRWYALIRVEKTATSIGIIIDRKCVTGCSLSLDWPFRIAVEKWICVLFVFSTRWD